MRVSPQPQNTQHPSWKDTFATSVSGNTLTVTRTDTKSGGWGQELELEAVLAKEEDSTTTATARNARQQPPARVPGGHHTRMANSNLTLMAR